MDEGSSARDQAAGDLDGDGDPDVAAVSAAGLVSWWEDESIHRRFVTAESVDVCTGLGDPCDVEVPDRSAYANVAPGDSWRFFLVLTADPDAGQHSPSSIRVSLPDDGVDAEDRSNDLSLLGEPNPALTTDPIALGDDSSLIFADGFDTGTAAAWSGVVP